MRIATSAVALAVLFVSCTTPVSLENVLTRPNEVIKVNATETPGGVAGAPVTNVGRVRVLDQFDEPLPNATVTYSVSGGSLTTTAVQTDASGEAVAPSWTLPQVAGNASITATVTGVTPVVFSGAVIAGPPAKVAVSAGNNQTGVVGQALATAPAAVVQDQFNNAVGAGISVTFTVGANSGTVQATSSSGQAASGAAITNSSGVVAIFAWRPGTKGANTLTAALTSNSAANTSFTATGQAGPPASIAIVTESPSSQNQATIANTAVAVAPGVVVRDANNIPVDAGVAVTFTIVTGGGLVSATSGGAGAATASVSTDVNGVARLGYWKPGTPNATNTMRAELASNGAVNVMFNATGTFGPPTAITYVNSPWAFTQQATVNGGQPAVRVVDGGGNLLNGVGITWSNSGSATSTVGGTTTSTTNAQGIAGFTGTWTANGAPGATMTLAATVTGSAPALAATAQSTITGAPATIAVQTGVAATTTVNTTTANAAVVVRDAGNRPVPGVPLSWTYTANPSPTPPAAGTITGSSAATDSIGIGFVGTWRVAQAIGVNTVQAAVSSPSLTQSFSTTGTAGPVTNIVQVSQSAASAPVNDVISTVSQVNDQFGNPVSGVTVSYAVGPNPTNASFLPGNSLTGASGQAGATWRLDTLARNNQLVHFVVGTPSINTVFSATSTPGAASKLAKQAGDLQTAQVSTTLPVAPKVRVTDQYNNTVTTPTNVQFFPAANSGTVTTSGCTAQPICTVASDGSGDASITWTLGSIVGTQTLDSRIQGATLPQASFNATATDPPGWSTKASMPSGVREMAVAAINGLLYAAGGHNGTSDVATMRSYNPVTNSWATLSSMPGGRYQGSGAGVINGEMYVAGGWTTTPGVPHNDLYVFNPSSGWRSQATMLTLSGCGTAGVVGTKLYVHTPCDGNSGYRQFMHVYDQPTNAWTSRANSNILHTVPAAGVINGIMYVAGGHDVNGTALATLEAYDPNTNTWSTKTSMTVARYGATAAVVGGQLYVIGGRNTAGTALQTVERYDPVSNSWATLTAMPTARSGAGAAVINGVIYVVGGQPTGSGAPLTTVEVFVP